MGAGRFSRRDAGAGMELSEQAASLTSNRAKFVGCEDPGVMKAVLGIVVTFCSEVDPASSSPLFLMKATKLMYVQESSRVGLVYNQSGTALGRA